jgi:hypothetical protein
MLSRVLAKIQAQSNFHVGARCDDSTRTVSVPVFARISLLQYLAETGELSQEVIPTKKES